MSHSTTTNEDVDSVHSNASRAAQQKGDLVIDSFQDLYSQTTGPDNSLMTRSCCTFTLETGHIKEIKSSLNRLHSKPSTSTSKPIHRYLTLTRPIRLEERSMLETRVHPQDAVIT
ncbi:hypothetical protein PGT21_027385 [Puccinia graminis f. sp. tritici]|uniref:Uncharacterized protein n=1 Tax=Puccinia graminis f. sp. tritici TaxID=56615 RepID=A0A5B0QNZ9_PUCGR|nr:hypothetical protein PGT21_027385 [Puccinia graminis f. sp. tritici]